MGRYRAPAPDRSARAPGRARPAHDPRDHVLRLQRAAGNAATTRLIGAARRSVARFGEPEHKGIGDAALDRRWRLPGSALFKELELTFGDWVALGDWFENVGDIKRIVRGEALEGEEDVKLVKPDKSGNRPDTIGQLYYAVLVKIRPKTEGERQRVEKAYMGTLFSAVDKDAVEERYARLKTRNIKHFPNPLTGDTELGTAEKATRRRERSGDEASGRGRVKPFGAIAQYRADHQDAIFLAMSAGQLDDDRLLGEAIAMDGFACHYLTDAFSASHTRTPRSSIEAYWDKKVPGFEQRLEKWLADEIMFAVHRNPSGLLEWLGATVGAPFKLVRAKAREKVKPVVPALSFGDVVGLVVHDWEGAHGRDRHGPLVDVAGQRFRTVGDDGLIPVLKTFAKPQSDTRLKAALRNKKGSDAERTFAGATLAVRASVADLELAFDLARKKHKRKDILASLIGKDGLFASERYIPKAVPDAKQPEDDRMPKWDFATVDELLADPKIRAALPESAAKVAEPFEDTIKHLDASKAVKDQIQLAVVNPLKSGDLRRIGSWVKSVIDYAPENIERRLEHGENELRQDLVDLRAGGR
jgi:hypothetical protein